MSVEVLNPRAIDLNFAEISRRIGIKAETIQKKLAFDIFADIVANTPIDTGRAMNNWNISVGVHDYSVTSEGGGDGSVQSRKKAKASAELASVKLGVTIWISNSLPYIQFLNEGSSIQAPANFVENAVVANLNALSRFF
jgi:hypothetical protein